MLGWVGWAAIHHQQLLPRSLGVDGKSKPPATSKAVCQVPSNSTQRLTQASQTPLSHPSPEQTEKAPLSFKIYSLLPCVSCHIKPFPYPYLPELPKLQSLLWSADHPWVLWKSHLFRPDFWDSNGSPHPRVFLYYYVCNIIPSLPN